MPALAIPYSPALANVKFYSQWFTRDPKLGVALSHGIETTTPTRPKTFAARLYGDLKNPTGRTDTLGSKALVVRFGLK